MGRDEIFAVLKQNVATVLSVDPEAVLLRGKLADLGANSMDRMEIVTLTMEALEVKAPLVDLADITNIEALVDFFHARKASRPR